MVKLVPTGSPELPLPTIFKFKTNKQTTTKKIIHFFFLPLSCCFLSFFLSLLAPPILYTPAQSTHHFGFFSCRCILDLIPQFRSPAPAPSVVVLFFAHREKEEETKEIVYNKTVKSLSPPPHPSKPLSTWLWTQPPACVYEEEKMGRAGIPEFVSSLFPIVWPDLP